MSTDTGFGTIYVSDDRGTVYSKSLERHLYTTTGGDTDFTNVTSLRGVFITSVLAAGTVAVITWIGTHKFHHINAYLHSNNSVSLSYSLSFSHPHARKYFAYDSDFSVSDYGLPI